MFFLRIILKNTNTDHDICILEAFILVSTKEIRCLRAKRFP
jgi:hypothetical protein